MVRNRKKTGHWEAIVDLLEEYELNKTSPRAKSTVSFWVGVLILSIGIIGIVRNFGVFNADDQPDQLGQWVYLGSVIVMIPGMLLIGSGVSSRVFFQLTKSVKRLSSIAMSVFLSVCTLISFTCCIIICYGLIKNPKGLDSSDYTALATFSMAFIALVFISGIGPVDIGVIKPRSGVSARSWSIFLELICLVGPMSVVTVSVGWSVGAAGLVLSFTLALVGYSKYRYSRLDLAFSETVRIMDTLRAKALRVVEARNIGEARCLYGDLLESYRSLHMLLNSGPSMDRRAVKSFGLNALCVVAEMRARGESDYLRFLEGDKRVKAAKRCRDMSNSDFALASAQVFDAFIRMLDRSFAPRSKKGAENKELRKSLNYYAL